VAQFSVCLIQPPGYVHSLALLEVCHLLCFSLESLHQSCRFEVNRLEAGANNIVVGYHLLTPDQIAPLAGQQVIFYQLEQLPLREGWFTADREAVLRAARAVWDYSPHNLELLRARGFERLHHLPLGYHPKLKRIPHREESARDIDVLFYGSMNARRAAVVDSLRARCRTQVLFGVYGDSRDEYIARSRIVLNVHFYEAKILEQVRLSYLLNNECFVLSEEAEQNPFLGAAATGPYDQLADLCRSYLAAPESRRQIAAAGHRIIQDRPMVDHLRSALEALPQ